MQPLDKSKNKVQRYCCSNPNCKKVFSKPKIIKYYVCPTCQTLVDDLPSENFHPPTREKPVEEKKQVARGKRKESKQDKKQESRVITSQQATTSNELTSWEKPEVKEILETIMPAQMEEPKPNAAADIALNKKSQITVEEKTCQPSDVQCPYYFGYLGQRNKETAIPETCFECPKSIECMLSEYNGSQEGVKEIKKWYPFKF
jgi:hypothetical protein